MVFFTPQIAGTVFRTRDITTKFIELPYTDKTEVAMQIKYTKDGLWEVLGDSPLAAEAKL